jgi:hypothetical protein
VSLGSQARVDSAAASIQDARTTMERMVRELREGSGLVPGTTATASSISVVTYVDSTCSGTPSSSANRCSVTYSCSGGICTRRVAQADGTSPGSAVQVIKGLSSSSIFSYSPSAASPQYIAIRLALPTTTGGNAITLTDGAALRNWGL